MLKPPKLKPNQYSVLMIQASSGIVLQTNGQFDIGNGDVFSIFDNIHEAESYIAAMIKKSNDIEFSLHDSKGAFVEIYR